MLTRVYRLLVDLPRLLDDVQDTPLETFAAQPLPLHSFLLSPTSTSSSPA